MIKKTTATAGAGPSIQAENICVQLPTHSAKKSTLKRAAVRFTTGGKLLRDERGDMNVLALDNVSFNLKAGDRIALSGPNGAGKTTLLRVLAGIYPPTSGTLTIKGRRAAILNPLVGLNPEATGLEAFRMQSLLNGIGEDEIKQAIGPMIEFTELGEFIEMPLRTYSQGMKTRIAVAAATAYPVDIILIDEGIGVADKEFQEKAWSRLDNWLSNAAIIVLASHAESLIRHVCSERITLANGNIIDRTPIV